MPRYEYACPDCSYTLEVQQKFADTPLKECPACKKKNLYRMVGNVAVAFRGSGFYINDSKSGSKSAGKPAKPKTNEDKVETASTSDAALTKEPKENKDVPAVSANQTQNQTESKTKNKTDATP